MSKRNPFSENFEVAPRPCVGCGFCCIKAPCELAVGIYGNGITECPALVWSKEKGRYLCDLVGKGNLVSALNEKRLYIGDGCCCGMNSWRNEVIPRREKDMEAAGLPMSLPPIFQLFLAGLGKEWTISGDKLFFVFSNFRALLIKNMGYSHEDATEIANLAIHYTTQSRSGKFDSFMGSSNVTLPSQKRA